MAMASPPRHPSSDHLEDGSPELYCGSESPMQGDYGFGIAGAFEKYNNFVPPSPKGPSSDYWANIENEIRDIDRIKRDYEEAFEVARELDEARVLEEARKVDESRVLEEARKVEEARMLEEAPELEEARELLARKRAPRSQRRRGLNVSGAGTSLAEGTTSQAKFHKGVRMIRDGRYTSRVCVPGGRNRKMDLGEFKSPNQAACAYRIAADYLGKDKPSSSTPEEVEFFKKLPPVPDSLSPAAKLAWIKKTARHYSSESPYMHRDGFGNASPPTSTTLQQPDAAGCSSLVSSPPNLHQEVALTTSGSAPPQYRFVQFQGGQQPGVVGCDFHLSTPPNDGMFGISNSALTASARAPIELCAGFQNGPTLQQPGAGWSSSFVSTPLNDVLFGWTVPTTSGSLVPQGRMNGVLGSDPEKRAETPVPNVDGTSPDQVPASEPRMTDSIVSAPSELRVLVSLPRTQQAAPALLMIQSIISAFYELRQQGCVVQLTIN